jgi:hypothetical protein
MAITLVGTASGSALNGDDVTITLPAGLAENDLVLVIGGTGSAGSDATIETAGYTTAAPYNHSDLSGIVGYKLMSSSPDTTVLCNGGGAASDGVAYVVMAFRGVHASIIDASVQVVDLGGDPNSPAITTVTDGAAVISAFISEDAWGTIVNPPTGYGSVVSVARPESNGVHAGAAYKIITPAGTENPGVWDTDFASIDNINWTIAIKPATAGVANDGVFAATGTSAVAFEGFQDADGRLESPLLSTIAFKGTAIDGKPLSASGTGTASFVGNSIATSGAFSMTGTGTLSGVGGLSGGAPFSIRGTITPEFSAGTINDVLFTHSGEWAVSFVGGTSNMTSVREVVESRGAATVRLGR